MISIRFPKGNEAEVLCEQRFLGVGWLVTVACDGISTTHAPLSPDDEPFGKALQRVWYAGSVDISLYLRLPNCDRKQ